MHPPSNSPVRTKAIPRAAITAPFSRFAAGPFDRSPPSHSTVPISEKDLAVPGQGPPQFDSPGNLLQECRRSGRQVWKAAYPVAGMHTGPRIRQPRGQPLNSGFTNGALNDDDGLGTIAAGLDESLRPRRTGRRISSAKNATGRGISRHVTRLTCRKSNVTIEHDLLRISAALPHHHNE